MDAAVTARLDDDDGADGLSALPKGWVASKLEEIVERLTDGTHQPPKFTSSGIPFVVIGSVSGDRIDWSSIKKWVSPSTFLSESKRLRPSRDDILYTAVGSYGLAIRVLDDREFMFQRHIAYLRPCTTLVDPTYLCYALNSPILRRQADRAARGVAQKTVTLGSLREFNVPLAPLAEQRRIVARVDALFAEIAEGEVALAAARKGLDTFRRALLKAAVTGELTKDWRTANPVTETGDDVLTRISKYRASDGAQKARARRATGTKPLDNSALPDLPESWAWASLGEIGEIVGGATVDKKRKPTDPVTVPYLRVANVQRGHVDLSTVKRITVERASAEKLRLVAGDLLLNEGGDRDKIGRGWVWEATVPDMIHQNHVFRVRLHSDSLNPFFVSHYANEMGRRFFIEGGKQTTNLASISLSKISMLPVPIPPPAEAAEILRRVSDALAAAADVLAVFDAEAADAARLKQSILKAAFEGRLVPQDPADEPASALLARLAVNTSAIHAKRGRARKSAV
jgi:type I restriction enzyme, S subunit